MQNKLNIYSYKKEFNNSSLENLIFYGFMRSFGFSQIKQIENCVQTEEGIHIFPECESGISFKLLKRYLMAKETK